MRSKMYLKLCPVIFRFQSFLTHFIRFIRHFPERYRPHRFGKLLIVVISTLHNFIVYNHIPVRGYIHTKNTIIISPYITCQNLYSYGGYNFI